MYQGRGNRSGGRSGRFNSGRGSGGRSRSNDNNSNNRRGNNSHNNNNSRNNNNNSNELKFTPHYSGKQQMATYDTVKDHIIVQIQKTFKYGMDMAKSLRNSEYVNLREGRPTRMVVTIPKEATEADQMTLKIEQDGFDIAYQEDLREYNNRVKVFEENKYKAFSVIWSYCNKVMQNRIEESPEFESRIRDEPLELLKEIKAKMYDPARARYEMVTLTESLRRILDTKQDSHENLIDYK